MVEVVCRSGPADRPFEERHDWTSVAVVLGGTFTYRSTTGRALMTPGSLLLGNAGACFECGHEHAAGDRCVAFQFAPDIVDETAGALRRLTATPFRRPRLPPLHATLPLVAEARAVAANPDPLRAEQVAIDVAAAALALDHETSEAPCDARDEKRIAAAVRIIETRSAEKLTIAGLAREVGLTRRRFAVAFRRTVGTTPYHYLLALRLDAAAARLRERGASVLSVALDAGFGDLSEFTRSFGARFGHSPGRYRRLRAR